MTEILRTNDLVMLSFLTALLRDSGLSPQVFDEGMNALDGNIGAFPRRLLVPEDEAAQARRVLTEAGYGRHLYN
ncbi:MAG: DUF2007 domain-containing protein [Pseudomonadota bacterium]